MKSKRIGITKYVITGAAALVLLSAAFYWYDNRLSSFQAKMLWSNRTFHAETFRTGPVEQRAAMAADILDQQLFIGKPSSLVERDLGPPDGDYYHNNPTYKLTDRGTTDWILTLKSDEDGKITRVFIRRSCCSVSRRIAVFAFLNILAPIVDFFLGSKVSI